MLIHNQKATDWVIKYYSWFFTGRFLKGDGEMQGRFISDLTKLAETVDLREFTMELLAAQNWREVYCGAWLSALFDIDDHRQILTEQLRNDCRCDVTESYAVALAIIGHLHPEHKLEIEHSFNAYLDDAEKTNLKDKGWVEGALVWLASNGGRRTHSNSSSAHLVIEILCRTIEFRRKLGD